MGIPSGMRAGLMLMSQAVLLAQTGTLFQDNFSTPGNQLNLGAWTTIAGCASYLGRTQLADWVTPGGVGKFVVGSNGAELALNTFNPTGSSLYGTQGQTLKSFQPTATTAIVFSTQLQLTSLQPGVVYSAYLYNIPVPCNPAQTNHDEIDIELVTNLLQPGAPLMVQLNRYANEPLGAGNGVLVNLPAGFDPLAAHTWTINWSLTALSYLVDNTLLYTTSTDIPQGSMQADVIAWGPDTSWPAAYSNLLQIAGSAAQNQSFVALLTSVSVVGTAVSGLDFYPVTPCRVVDTRSGAGFTGQFGPPSMVGGATRAFSILSSPCAAGIPATVAAYSLNFTAVPPVGGPEANLTTWPEGTAMPNVSTLNYYGSVVANAAIVPAGTNGEIDVYASYPTDMLFDINGYFAPPLSSGLEFYPVTPCRIADTRDGTGFTGQFGPPSMVGGATRAFSILSSSCAVGIPATVAAYSLNFTAVPPVGGPEANLTTWPEGTAMPNVSTLNYYGSVVANAAIVPAGANGAIDAYVSYPTDLLFDMNGYFAPASSSGLHFYPLTPCRVVDTRTGTGFTGQFGAPSMAGQQTRSFNILASSCATGIPPTVAAYLVNFTVVPPPGGPEANLTTWPPCLAIPNVSTLNFYGNVVAGMAIVPACTTGPVGPINVYVSYPTDLLIDLNGYFAP